MFRNQIDNKIIKSHNKKAYRGKFNFFVDYKFFLKVIIKLEAMPRKIKKWLFRRLARRRLVVNYRFLYLYFLKNIYLVNSVIYDPLRYMFYRFAFSIIVSLNYHHLTDYQLELMRRLARKVFGKKVYIKLYIKADRVLLRRVNQIRMGGGKGSKIFKRIYFLYPGCRVMEIRSATIKGSHYFIEKVNKKFPIKFGVFFANRL